MKDRRTNSDHNTDWIISREYEHNHCLYCGEETDSEVYQRVIINGKRLSKAICQSCRFDEHDILNREYDACYKCGSTENLKDCCNNDGEHRIYCDDCSRFNLYNMMRNNITSEGDLQ